MENLILLAIVVVFIGVGILLYRKNRRLFSKRELLSKRERRQKRRLHG